MKMLILELKKISLIFISTLLIPCSIAFADNIPVCTPGLCTIKNFLATAMQPVGQTLYMWGGGWNSEDFAAGETAMHIGIWPQWKEFFDSQDSTYNFHNYTTIDEDSDTEIPIPEFISLGLDCSGYRGWILYNVFHSQDMEGPGYVFFAGEIQNFIDNNWGIAINSEDIKDFRAGDIMAKPGHTYMVIGQCNDGSVVFTHSSPPGVHICGTVTPDGNEQSEAVELATYYMKKYYPEYDKKFSYKGYIRDSDYLTQYTQFRWNTNDVMKDPDGYTKMTAKQILKNLFSE